MKYLPLIIFYLLLSYLNSNAQVLYPRKLEVFTETKDSLFYFHSTGLNKNGNMEGYAIEPMIKKDKAGGIISLYQEVGNQAGEKIFVEDYKKGKRWDLTQFVHDTLQVLTSLTPEGNPLMEYYNKRKGKTDYESRYLTKYTIKVVQYDYYSTGKLKYKLEERYTQAGVVGKIIPWNVLEYYNPDGKPFKDWGTLKDGVGAYVILDDAGRVCDVCSQKQ